MHFYIEIVFEEICFGTNRSIFWLPKTVLLPAYGCWMSHTQQCVSFFLCVCYILSSYAKMCPCPCLWHSECFEVYIYMYDGILSCRTYTWATPTLTHTCDDTKHSHTNVSWYATFIWNIYINDRNIHMNVFYEFCCECVLSSNVRVCVCHAHECITSRVQVCSCHTYCGWIVHTHTHKHTCICMYA